MDDRLFLKRLHGLSLALILLGFLTMGRLFWLQIIRHSHYAVLASEEQLRKLEVLPERGTIYLSDRDQLAAVAMNRSLKKLYVDARLVKDKTETAAELAAVTGGDESAYLKAIQTDSGYVVLAHHLGPTTAATITKLDLVGVGLQDEPVRVYPESKMAAPVLGFVNSEGIGQYGVEEQYNKQLAGERGLLKATTDVRGIPIATTNNYQIPPQRGDDIVLTIDRNIQAKVEAVIAEGVAKYHPKAASALLMDPTTGAILAMANWPSFNPARFGDVSDYSLFSNRTTTNLYEPGSVMKIFTMATGLDSGAVTPTTTYQDHGSVTIGDRTIQNARGIPTGTYTMNQVIAKSINSGVIFVLTQLGGGTINPQAKTKFHNYLVGKFRFSKPTGIDLPGEASGQVFGPDESPVTYANMTFGQGLSATMLQVVTGYAAIANGGNMPKPYVVDAVIKPDGAISKTKPSLLAKDLLAPDTIDQLKTMMEGVVNNPAGPEAKIAGYKVGGKSGTAQIPNPAGGYFENRDIGSFIGIAPLNKPQFVLMVRIDEPQIGTFASAAARPMWGEIMRWLVQYRGVPPG